MNLTEAVFDWFFAGTFALDEGLGVAQRGVLMNPELPIEGSFRVKLGDWGPNGLTGLAWAGPWCA